MGRKDSGERSSGAAVAGADRIRITTPSRRGFPPIAAPRRNRTSARR